MSSIVLNQAVILAGGQGERLKPLTNHIPKPLALINGIPFLDYLIHSLVEVGIKEILLLVGYKYEQIVNRYNRNVNSTVKISFSVGSESDMTGRRLLNAYPQLEAHFMLLYGDNYWSIDLDNMLNFYNRKNVHATTTVFSNLQGTGEYGWGNNIKTGADNHVLLYDKKRKSNECNGVDIGYFILSKAAIDPNIRGNISFEENILPKFIDEKQLAAFFTDEQYYYITDLDSLNHFESIVLEKGYDFIGS